MKLLQQFLRFLYALNLIQSKTINQLQDKIFIKRRILNKLETLFKKEKTVNK